MSDTAVVDPATPSSAEGAETYSKSYVDDLKAKLEEKSKSIAQMTAKFSLQQDRQRAALKGMQSDVESFVEEAFELAPDEMKHEIEPMRTFAKTLGESENPDSAMPLARVICLSSGKFKRDRAEFSKNSDVVEQLATANSKIDELTSADSTQRARISELENLCDERQGANEKLQAELAKFTTAYQFSNVSNREADAKPNSVPVPGKSIPSAPAAPAVDPLMSFLSEGSSNAGRRIMPSGTSHGFLGAVAGSSSDGGVSEALRGL